MIGIWVPCRQRTSQIINCAFKATMLTIFTSHSGIHFAATLVKVCPRLPRRTENRRAMSFSSIREEREIFCRARLQVLSCSDRPELRIHLAANYTPAGGGEEGSFLKPLTPSLLGLDASELFENNANSSVFCQRTIIFFPQPLQPRVSQNLEIEIDFCGNKSPSCKSCSGQKRYRVSNVADKKR